MHFLHLYFILCIPRLRNTVKSKDTIYINNLYISLHLSAKSYFFLPIKHFLFTFYMFIAYKNNLIT